MRKIYHIRDEHKPAKLKEKSFFFLYKKNHVNISFRRYEKKKQHIPCFFGDLRSAAEVSTPPWIVIHDVKLNSCP